MSVTRTPSGRFKATYKQHGAYIASKTFDLQRDAKKWERQQIDAHADVFVARRSVSEVLDEFLSWRIFMIAESTFRNERYIFGVMTPDWFKKLQLVAVTSPMITRLLVEKLQHWAYATMMRYRSSLSSFFSYCVKMDYLNVNPVRNALLPRRSQPEREMQPFTLEEFTQCFDQWYTLNPRAAEIIRFQCYTGLRWGESRALLVSDVHIESEYAYVSVSKSRPEGMKTRTTKSGKTRNVPLSSVILPFVRSCMQNKQSSELLLPPMHRARLMQQLDWPYTACGRRLHDCRHTAITWWLASGVDITTVRSWAGHSSLNVTSRYTHHLGTEIDRRSLHTFEAFTNHSGNFQKTFSGSDTFHEIPQFTKMEGAA